MDCIERLFLQVRSIILLLPLSWLLFSRNPSQFYIIANGISPYGRRWDNFNFLAGKMIANRSSPLISVLLFSHKQVHIEDESGDARGVFTFKHRWLIVTGEANVKQIEKLAGNITHLTLLTYHKFFKTVRKLSVTILVCYWVSRRTYKSYCWTADSPVFSALFELWVYIL